MGYLDYPGLQRYHGKVQDEIDELKDDLNGVYAKCVLDSDSGIYEKVGSSEMNITSGKYFNDYGEERTTTNQDFMITDFVSVEDVFKVRAKGTGAGPYCVFFYNDDNEYLQRFSTTGQVDYDYELDVPINAAYIRIGSYVKLPEIYRQAALGELFETLNEKTFDYTFVKNGVIYTNEYVGDESINISGGFINKYGQLVTDASISPSCYYSDFIPLDTRDLLFSGNCTASVKGVHYYDINQDFIGNEVTSQVSKTSLTIPENAYYIRLTSYQDKFILWYPKTVKDVLSAFTGVNNLESKKVCLIGDSITEYNFRAKVNWAMLLEHNTLCTVQNLGISGTGFARYNPYINRISSINANSNIIGVACSFNDLDAGLPLGDITDTGTSSVCGYINDFFTALITAFPITPIICYCQNPWATARLGETDSDNYINAVKQICEKNNIPFYGEMYYKGSALRPWILANCQEYFTSDNDDIGNTGVVDNAHPNSKGHVIIERHLVECFNKNVI